MKKLETGDRLYHNTTIVTVTRTTDTLAYLSNGETVTRAPRHVGAHGPYEPSHAYAKKGNGTPRYCLLVEGSDKHKELLPSEYEVVIRNWISALRFADMETLYRNRRLIGG